jgi:propanediol dehydratase large subunit
MANISLKVNVYELTNEEAENQATAIRIEKALADAGFHADVDDVLDIQLDDESDDLETEPEGYSWRISLDSK